MYLLWPSKNICATYSLHKEYTGHTVLAYRHVSVGGRCCFRLLKGEKVEEYECLQLQQTKLAGAGDGFRAALHLEFVEDPTVVPFDRIEGEEEAFADLSIRESLGN